MQLFKISNPRGMPPATTDVNAVCPGCQQNTRFVPIGGEDIEEDVSFGGPRLRLGYRKCPDPDCSTVIFFMARQGRVLQIYPTRINFDTQRIPDEIVSTMDEALTCFNNECYRAAGMMLRRTLEELCHQQQVEGENLLKKIEALREKIILSTELFKGLHDIRLLGNDAAHIEAQNYEDVGKEELEVAIEFTRELLHVVYQSSIITDKLAALKKASTDSLSASNAAPDLGDS